MTGNAEDLRGRLKAVVFDLDDTLVLSTVDFAKFKRLVIERMGDWGEDPSLYSLNETIVTIIKRYEERMAASGVGPQEARRRLEILNGIMDAVELERVDETVAFDGTRALLLAIRESGLKIGVLTRGCKEYAERAMRRTGILELVDACECRNSEVKAKPDPEAYLKLVKALGVAPEDTVFVGDHFIDAQCARNAGVPFIGVETGDVPRDLLLEAGSVLVFHDVGQMIGWFKDSTGN